MRRLTLHYTIIGLTILAICFLLNFNSHIKNIHGKLLKVNYQYEELCREWKMVLDKEKSPEPNKMKALADSVDLSSFFHCDNIYKEKHLSQRDQYYVMYNFVQAESEFACANSVTMIVPGDFRYLGNVIELVDRWQGPISIALYSPGDDFYTTLDSIAYSRNCQTKLIKSLVTFHLFYDVDHAPVQKNGINIINSYSDTYDCTKPPPWKSNVVPYRINHTILFPINVARNVAKMGARTYFVFPNDIELYPTRNFIPLFLEFVNDNLDLFEPQTKNVFSMPVFEVLGNTPIPENKTALKKLFKKKKAQAVHKDQCVECHRVIDYNKWEQSTEIEGLGVYSEGKRVGRYKIWNPFYVCSQKEPFWEERFTWEGGKDSAIQAYTLCIMDYTFHVFDNAFLIRKPSKKKNISNKFNNLVSKTRKLVRKIAKEIQEMYGYNSNCSVDTYNEKQ